MKTKEIWRLPIDKRIDAFIERYLELDEMQGCRTVEEKEECLEIATAIMPEMIKAYRKLINHGLIQRENHS
jgi:predicted transcriptional regulator